MEIPSYETIVRQQHGWRFGALTQDIWKTTNPSKREHLFPAAKSIVADLLELAAPENEDVASGRKKFKSAAKSLGGEPLRELFHGGSKNGSATSGILTKSGNTKYSVLNLHFS